MIKFRLFNLTALFLILSLSLFAQQATYQVSGKVITRDGNAASGISIVLKGSGLATMTAENGEFTFKRVKTGNYVLIASAIGLKKQDQAIRVTNSDVSGINLTLDENSSQLDEIVISSTKTNRFNKKQSEFVAKTPLSKLENPQVYTTVSKELLTDQLIFNVDEAVRNVPGMQKMWEATGRGGDGGSYYNTRGFIVQSNLRNGIAGIVTSDIDAVNLERLEVIKGPSATLFGSALTSYGGLINRVTKKPYETFGGEVAFSGGNNNFHRIHLDLNQPINDKLLFRINAAYNNEDTFQDIGFTKSSVFAPSLTYNASDRLTINLDAEVFYGTNTGKQAFFFYFPAADLGVRTADDLPVDYKKSYLGDGLFQRSRTSNFFAQVNYKISETFTSSTNFTSSNSFSNGFSPYFYLIPDGVIEDDPAKNGKSHYMARADQSTGNSKNNVLEVQQNFNGDFKIGGLRNRIVFGLDFIRADAKQNFYGSGWDIVPLNVPGFDYSNFNGINMSQKYATSTPEFTYPIVNITNTYSAYLSDVINITDKFSILAAVRADRFESKGGKTGGADDAVYNQNALSPKFGIVYQPIKDVISIFANYQNSFTNPGAYTKYDPSSASKTATVIAELEQANQIEGGVKLDAFKGKLSATISYYDIKVKDMLRSDVSLPAAGLFASVQDGAQLSKGIEAELIANPFKGLNIVGGFSYNDSKMETEDPDVNGRRPAYASSPILANLFFSYRLPDNAIKGLGFGFGGNYASDNKVINSVSSGIFILPAYTLLNASLFYENSKIRLGAKIDNLTNEKYWIGYGTANPQKLRSFAGSIAYKF